MHAHADRNPGQSHLLSPLLIYLFDTPQHMHANKSAHTGRQLKRKRRQVTYLLLLWRQPCVYFYSFHMHSPSSPFILSSLWREEMHQLMFSFTVIGWFKAASVNCAPLPLSPLLFIYTLPSSSSSLPFFFTLALFTFIPSKQVMSRASVSAGWYCEWGDVVWLFPVLMNFAWEGFKKKKKKKVPQDQNHLPTHLET